MIANPSSTSSGGSSSTGSSTGSIPSTSLPPLSAAKLLQQLKPEALATPPSRFAGSGGNEDDPFSGDFVAALSTPGINSNGHAAAAAAGSLGGRTASGGSGMMSSNLAALVAASSSAAAAVTANRNSKGAIAGATPNGLVGPATGLGNSNSSGSGNGNGTGTGASAAIMEPLVTPTLPLMSPQINGMLFSPTGLLTSPPIIGGGGGSSGGRTQSDGFPLESSRPDELELNALDEIANANAAKNLFMLAAHAEAKNSPRGTGLVLNGVPSTKVKKQLSSPDVANEMRAEAAPDMSSPRVGKRKAALSADGSSEYQQQQQDQSPLASPTENGRPKRQRNSSGGSGGSGTNGINNANANSGNASWALYASQQQQQLGALPDPYGNSHGNSHGNGGRPAPLVTSNLQPMMPSPPASASSSSSNGGSWKKGKVASVKSPKAATPTKDDDAELRRQQFLERNKLVLF